MEVLDSISTNMKLQNTFNLEVKDNLRPNGSKDTGLKEWEKNVLMHLNNVNLVKRDYLKPCT